MAKVYPVHPAAPGWKVSLDVDAAWRHHWTLIPPRGARIMGTRADSEVAARAAAVEELRRLGVLKPEPLCDDLFTTAALNLIADCAPIEAESAPVAASAVVFHGVELPWGEHSADRDPATFLGAASWTVEVALPPQAGRKAKRRGSRRLPNLEKAVQTACRWAIETGNAASIMPHRPDAGGGWIVVTPEAAQVLAAVIG